MVLWDVSALKMQGNTFLYHKIHSEGFHSQTVCFLTLRQHFPCFNVQKHIQGQEYHVLRPKYDFQAAFPVLERKKIRSGDRIARSGGEKAKNAFSGSKAALPCCLIMFPNTLKDN